jgi:hypothetical protein
MNKITINKCNDIINGREYYNKNLNKNKIINISLITCITIFLISIFITINTIIILKSVTKLVLLLLILIIFSLLCTHLLKDMYLNYKKYNKKYYYLGLPCYSNKENKVAINNKYENFDNDKYNINY